MKNIFLLIAVCISLIIAWFHKGLLFSTGEEAIPFHNLGHYYYITSYIWRTMDGGYPTLFEIPRLPIAFIFSIFYHLSVPSFLIQAGFFLFLMLVGTISFYFLTREVLKDYLPTKIIPIIAATFYLLNPYSMNQVWGRSLYMQYFPFALFPLFLLMIFLSINRQKIIYCLIALIGAFILSGAFSNITYILSLWMIIGLYAVFYLLFMAKNAKSKLYALFILIFTLVHFIGIQAWWIFPYFSNDNVVGSTSIGYFNTEKNIDVLKAVSGSSTFPNLIRLQHKGYFYEAAIYGDLYKSFFFQLMSWLIPIFTLIGIFKFKKSRYFVFFFTLFLIAIFIALGANFPLGWLMILIFKLLPILQAFRNPLEKIGIALLIPYSLFFAIGFYTISQKIKILNRKIVIILFLILLEGVYIWPMWTGQFAGGIRDNVWIKVPDYYNDADQWINSYAGEYRILDMPLVPGQAAAYTWDYPYGGQVPYEMLFKTASISKDISITRDYPNSFINYFKNGKLNKLLEDFAVKYIVVHKDIDYKRTGSMSPGETETILKNYNNIKQITSFGMLDIYAVDLPPNINRIYSPEKELTQIQNINPTLYKISVANNFKPFNLYFLEYFDNGWEATIDNEKIIKHSKALDYANVWAVDKMGSFDILIQYKPQLYLQKGFKISFAFIGLIILYSGFLGIKKIYKSS